MERFIFDVFLVYDIFFEKIKCKKYLRKSIRTKSFILNEGQSIRIL